MNKSTPKPSLLLAACCGPCATVALEDLSPHYEVTVFFWGSNIHPREEYEKRLASILILAPKAVIAEYKPAQSESCEQCFETRLRTSAEYARKNSFEYFATTLTASPHKPAEIINQIGIRIAPEYGINYFPTDFKKNNGFARSVAISKQLGLYRQSYCGCTRSLTPRKTQAR